ncbi:MAG: PepSY domain-containing protein [Nitrosopumilaceae archaeon]
MNQIISNKKTMLAIVLGIAIVATIGTSVSVYAENQSNNTGISQIPPKFMADIPKIQGSIDINQILMQNVKTKFVDAANTAQSAVTGGTVVSGDLGPYQGYYVYNFRVLDSSSKIHLVIVDAGDGKVLSNTDAPDEFFAMSGKMIGVGPMGDISYQAMSPGEQVQSFQIAPPQTK